MQTWLVNSEHLVSLTRLRVKQIPFRTLLAMLLFLWLHLLIYASSMTVDEVKKQLQTIQTRVEEFQEWSKSNPGHLDACNGCTGKVRRDSGINKLEVHLAKYVGIWADALLKRNDKDVLEMYEGGHRCTPAQAKSQMEMYRHVRPHICSEMEVYKIAHLVDPELTTFVDVGANRGFIGSTFVGLWGGNGHGVTPDSVYNISQAFDLYPRNRNPFGYCKTGMNLAFPLYCPEGKRRGYLGACDVKRDVRVFSIDGSANLKTQVGRVIKTLNVQNMWSYDNYAVSNEVGFIQFTKQNATHNSGLEGGSMQHKTSRWVETETVPMTTIDSYMDSVGFKGVIDVIKIDAESYDLVAILGAKKTIARGTKMITYEHSKIANRKLAEQAFAYFKSLKYSCYSAAFKFLYKLDDGCILFKNFLKYDWGNVYCASQIHAPHIVAAFDAISFLPLHAHEKTMAEEAKGTTAD